MNEISAGGIARVTLVWEMPASGTSVDDPDTSSRRGLRRTKSVGRTPDPTPDPCLTNWGFWTMKEGTGNPGSEGPDTFAEQRDGCVLCSVPDPAKARGYALTPVGASACTANPSLETAMSDQATSSRPRLCASRVPGLSNFPLNPGLVIEIDEGGAGIHARPCEARHRDFVHLHPVPGRGSRARRGSCPAIPATEPRGTTPWSFDGPETTTSSSARPSGSRSTTRRCQRARRSTSSCITAVRRCPSVRRAPTPARASSASCVDNS